MNKRFKIYFNKTTAVAWALFGPTAFFIGWAESVALVWIASVWANVKSDWATAEAVDDRELKGQLDRIEEQQHNIIELMEAILDGTRHSCDGNRSSSVLRPGYVHGFDAMESDTSRSIPGDPGTAP